MPPANDRGAGREMDDAAVPPAAARARVPVIIVTGFLGAGKVRRSTDFGAPLETEETRSRPLAHCDMVPGKEKPLRTKPHDTPPADDAGEPAAPVPPRAPPKKAPHLRHRERVRRGLGRRRVPDTRAESGTSARVRVLWRGPPAIGRDARGARGARRRRRGDHRDDGPRGARARRECAVQRAALSRVPPRVGDVRRRRISLYRARRGARRAAHLRRSHSDQQSRPRLGSGRRGRRNGGFGRQRRRSRDALRALRLRRRRSLLLIRIRRR
mmetsp:Transcript_5893/g.24657  ORF Transcript_5893/g.24657 Transcript_5893/m.24657 type:complete len:269 (-) Transcript_5893:1887-2693(-)